MLCERRQPARCERGQPVPCERREPVLCERGQPALCERKEPALCERGRQALCERRELQLDCGVCALKFMQCEALNVVVDLCFETSQVAMTNFRRRMLLEIMEGEIHCSQYHASR